MAFFIIFNFSYKQQHQIFIQHAAQQIAILDTQKLALKVPQPQTSSQLSQPPIQSASADQAQLTLLANECDSNQNSINGNANNFNRNDNRLNSGPPPPLMSQNISMPRTGMNPNYISSQQQQQQRINFPGENNFQVRNIYKYYLIWIELKIFLFLFRIPSRLQLQCKTVYRQ